MVLLKSNEMNNSSKQFHCTVLNEFLAAGMNISV